MSIFLQKPLWPCIVLHYIIMANLRLAKRHITFFGKTNFRNQYERFGIKTEDRRKHIYVVGDLPPKNWSSYCVRIGIEKGGLKW